MLILYHEHIVVYFFPLQHYYERLATHKKGAPLPQGPIPSALTEPAALASPPPGPQWDADSDGGVYADTGGHPDAESDGAGEGDAGGHPDAERSSDAGRSSEAEQHSEGGDGLEVERGSEAGPNLVVDGGSDAAREAEAERHSETREGSDAEGVSEAEGVSDVEDGSEFEGEIEYDEEEDAEEMQHGISPRRDSPEMQGEGRGESLYAPGRGSVSQQDWEESRQAGGAVQPRELLGASPNIGGAAAGAAQSSGGLHDSPLPAVSARGGTLLEPVGQGYAAALQAQGTAQSPQALQVRDG